MKYFLSVLGLVLIVEGLPYFTYPGHIKTFLQKVSEFPDPTLRVLGAVSVAAGLLLLYFGTR